MYMFVCFTELLHPLLSQPAVQKSDFLLFLVFSFMFEKREGSFTAFDQHSIMMLGYIWKRHEAREIEIHGPEIHSRESHAVKQCDSSISITSCSNTHVWTSASHTTYSSSRLSLKRRRTMNNKSPGECSGIWGEEADEKWGRNRSESI